MAALADTGQEALQVRALVAADSPHLGALQAQAEAAALPIAIMTGVTDMPAQYGWADCAVTAGGGTLWELAYTGVPALTLVVAATTSACGSDGSGAPSASAQAEEYTSEMDAACDVTAASLDALPEPSIRLSLPGVV